MEFLSLEWWDGASYVVTVIGLPFAIGVFLMEQRRERQNEEEEIFQYLSEEYAEFQKLALENADLMVSTKDAGLAAQMTPEQRERRGILYDILISLFERAYILVYEDKMSRQTARLWASWEDYMRDWCRQPDFRNALADLLQGEDPEFKAYLYQLVAEETQAALK